MGAGEDMLDYELHFIGSSYTTPARTESMLDIYVCLLIRSHLALTPMSCRRFRALCYQPIGSGYTAQIMESRNLEFISYSVLLRRGALRAYSASMPSYRGHVIQSCLLSGMTATWKGKKLSIDFGGMEQSCIGFDVPGHLTGQHLGGRLQSLACFSGICLSLRCVR